jgi:hypothetical protein
VKILGREPALWLALVAAAAQLSTAFGLDLTTGQQASINAAAIAVVGVITAFVTRDGISAAVLGLIQAGVSLGVGFGLHWSPDQQSTVMAFAAALVAMFVRTQVTAPVAALGRPTRTRTRRPVSRA